MITKQKWIEARVRNLLIPKYNLAPIYSIKYEYEKPYACIHNKILAIYFECHTADWEQKLADAGFVFLKRGYFSKIYQFPPGLLD